MTKLSHNFHVTRPCTQGCTEGRVVGGGSHLLSLHSRSMKLCKLLVLSMKFTENLKLAEYLLFDQSSFEGYSVRIESPHLTFETRK